MSESNAYFDRPQRASYEFGQLLRSLPADLDAASTAPTASDSAKLQAAERHATHYSDTLLNGLESLGHVMWSAGVNERQPVAPEHFADLGLLITELAVQLQFLGDFRAVANERLQQTEQGRASE